MSNAFQKTWHCALHFSLRSVTLTADWLYLHSHIFERPEMGVEIIARQRSEHKVQTQLFIDFMLVHFHKCAHTNTYKHIHAHTYAFVCSHVLQFCKFTSFKDACRRSNWSRAQMKKEKHRTNNKMTIKQNHITNAYTQTNAYVFYIKSPTVADLHDVAAFYSFN